MLSCGKAQDSTASRPHYTQQPGTVPPGNHESSMRKGGEMTRGKIVRPRLWRCAPGARTAAEAASACPTQQRSAAPGPLACSLLAAAAAPQAQGFFATARAGAAGC